MSIYFLVFKHQPDFSCEEPLEKIFDNPFMTASTEPITSQPIVGSENVIFEGISKKFAF